MPAKGFIKNPEMLELAETQCMTVEELITVKMVQVAIDEGNVQAYGAIMDSAYGKAKQAIEHTDNVVVPIDYSQFNEAELMIIKQAQELLSGARNKHIEEVEVVDQPDQPSTDITTNNTNI